MHGLVRAGRAQHRHVIVRAPDDLESDGQAR